MEYNGKYKIFDPPCLNTYPISERTNKVKLVDIVKPDDIDTASLDVSRQSAENTDATSA